MTTVQDNPDEPLEVLLTRPCELSSCHRESWQRMQSEHLPIQSPFLHPEFALAVERVRNDVELAVLMRDNVAVGFFPFQRDRRNVGHPLGMLISDFQGVICEKGISWNPVELTRKCGLKSWHFDHLIASQESLSSYHSVVCDSPYIDLRSGWDSYAQSRKAAGSKEVSTTQRKLRKLEREVGQLRFEFHLDEEQVFAQLLDWKAAQHRKTQTHEVLRYPWVRNLLDLIFRTSQPGFAGTLSALYAGDHLVAAHLGMHSEDVFHMWFPAYNPQFEKYSPGLGLLVLLSQHCAEHSFHRIDLGKGSQRFKDSFKSASIPVAEGAVSTQPIERWMNNSWYLGRQMLRESRFREALQAPKRMLRQFHYWRESI